MTLFGITIRQALPADIQAITDIYNESVLATVATFDTEPRSVEDRREWFDHHDETFPVIVAENTGEAENLPPGVVGWASLSRWSDRKAYNRTAEVSLYIAKKAQGCRIGTALFDEIILKGKAAGLHTIISRIAEGNAASIRLHENSGFFHAGILKEVGFKFGRFIDVYIMQKML